MNKELEWVSKHPKEIEKYAGKWVGIVDNKIICVGNSAKEVLEKAKIKQPLIFKVPRKDEEMYILWN